jgi:hypothetical protein
MRAALLSLGARFRAAEFTAPTRLWRPGLVFVPHLAAFAIMASTETWCAATAAFLFAWALLNCLWLALLRRPAAAGMLSLIMVIVLVLLSQLKHQVLMMTANFVDLMIVDTDTVAFLFTIFPALRWIAVLSAIAIVPLIVLTWRLDAFRVGRVAALC